jgi:hypothetical protein
MAQTLGIVGLIWKGRKIPVEKGAKYKPAGPKNNVVVVGRQVHRAEEFEAGEVTGTTVLKKGQRYGDLYGTGEGELQFECDTGQTFIAPDAFQTDRPDITGGEGGKVELKWAIGDVEEVVVG